MSKSGILYPTVSAMSAGTPRDSAIANQQSADKSQTALINAVGGKRYKRGGSNLAVPQFQMTYKPTGGPGQDPNSVIKDNASVSTQSDANAVYDKYATQMGGIRRRKRGGNPDWVWGCYSGGKKKTIKKRMSKRNRTRSKRKLRRRRKR